MKMPSENNVFKLSIVLRTQLKRIDCLEDALLCLVGQSDQSFELLIVLHSEQGRKELDSLLSKQPKSLNDKVQVLQTTGGNRGVPLNVGIAASNGTHIAFFDDDDLLTSNWVEEFHKAGVMHPVNILRSQVGTLWSQRVLNESNKEQVIQIAEPTAEYCSTYSHTDHLLVSHTPFMSLCFPISLFEGTGLIADENLAVCEDWDLLLRASNVLEVVDIPVVTSFYRRWIDQETSYSLYAPQVWQASEEAVLSKLSEDRLVLPGKEIFRIRELLELEKESHYLRQAAEEKAQMELSISWRITAPLRSIRAKFRRISSEKKVSEL